MSFGAAVAETKFGRGEQAIDDPVIPAHPVVHELRGLALGADDGQRWHLDLGNAVWKFDVDLAVIIEDVQRAPGRAAALDCIAEAQAAGVDQDHSVGRSFWRRSAISWSWG